MMQHFQILSLQMLLWPIVSYVCVVTFFPWTLVSCIVDPFTVFCPLFCIFLSCLFVHPFGYIILAYVSVLWFLLQLCLIWYNDPLSTKFLPIFLYYLSSRISTWLIFMVSILCWNFILSFISLCRIRILILKPVEDNLNHRP